MSDAFTVQAEALPDARLIALSGVEAISKPYLFRLHVLVRDGEIDLAGALGTRAIVHTTTDYTGAPIRFAGIIAAIEHAATEGKLALYEVEVRPALWRLSLSHHNRIFTDMSVPDILDEVLSAGLAGSAHDASGLTASYAARDHVCQYHESDLAFLSRWMEREGIAYYFDHSGDAETLMLVDDVNVHQALRDDPVRYRSAGAGDTSALEVMSVFRGAARLTTGAVSLTDYDPSNPQRALEAEEKVVDTSERRVMHGMNVVADCDRITKVIAERLKSGATRYRGHGQVAGIRAGYTFELAEHRSDAFNRGYLAVTVEHHVNQTGGAEKWRHLLDVPFEDVYRMDVEAQHDDMAFRPDNTTPWPRIFGVENGVIDGPEKTDYAQIDDQGRYKVKVTFDESSLAGGQASTWIRMAQPHGGNPEGFHFPLRRGTEVMLSFLGGDPDQPIISGVLPNQKNPSLVTSANNTQNRIVTGGNNAIDIEDLAGEESITIHTPHQDTNIHMGHPDKDDYSLAINTDGDAEIDVDGTMDVTVDGEYTLTVKDDETKAYLSNTQETIFGDVSASIGNNQMSVTMNDELSVTIGNRLSATMGNSISQTVGNSFSQTMGNTVSEFMGNQMSRTMGMSDSVTMGISTSFFGGDNISTTMGNAVSTTMGNSTTNVIGNHFKTVTGNYLTMTVATDTSVFVGARVSAALAGDLSLFVGAKTDIALATNISLSAAVNISANAAIVIEACAAAGVKYETGTVESNTTSVSDVQAEIDSLKFQMKNITQSIMSVKNFIVSN